MKLLLPPGPTFTVGGDLLDPGELSSLSDNALFLRLIKAWLQAEGKRLEELSASEIKKRFFIDPDTLKRTDY